MKENLKNMNEIEEENEVFIKKILSKSKKVLFFCQAPGDIQYILHFIENCNSDCEIHIKIINVQGMFLFFKNIELKNVKMQFIPYKYEVRGNDLRTLLKSKFYLKKLYKNHFQNYKEFDVFFFTHFFDYITFFFISKLKQNNRTFFINHYDDIVLDRCLKYQKKTKKGIIKLIHYLNTGINFQVVDLDNKATIIFPFTKYNIPEIKFSLIDSEIYEKYSFKIGGKKKEKRILILENNFYKLNVFDDYIQTTLEILKIIPEKYEVFIKPHPRLGYSEFLKNHIKNKIPRWVPAEFINFSDFDLILCIFSTSLNFISRSTNKPIISMINLYNWKSDKKDELNGKTKGSEKIIFIDNISDLKNIFEI